MPVRAILTDIEGTTSSISFVKDVLFPYAYRVLPAFVRRHAAEPAVRQQLDAVWQQTGRPAGDLDGAIASLLTWIEEDRKVTPLKALQGMIWEQGYRDGDFRAHVYPDAAAKLREWHAAGWPLYVYSSGSVQAQKLFFGHSEAGNLLPLFRGHYDTETGGKREAESYRRIAADIGLPPGDILFLSDIGEEIDAAKTAGMQTVQLVRPEDYPNLRLADARRPAACSFSDIDPARTA
ncbi:MAG: acireductone synthase [Pseudomonadota bacterium]